jgi:ribosomal protein L12E/L44/L45/RPP1/RPP2
VLRLADVVALCAAVSPQVALKEKGVKELIDDARRTDAAAARPPDTTAAAAELPSSRAAS